MGKVSVDKFKSAMADHFLHQRLGAYFPLRLPLRPPSSIFGHFFRHTDAFINKHLTERPLEMGSMFPSLFDGIRLGRRHTTAPYLKQTNGSDQQKSSNFRIIPIKLEGGEKHGKSKPMNETNPIILDDDDAEMIDITGESSASQLSRSKCPCPRKSTTVESAITVDDDNVSSEQRSSTECCCSVNKANLRRSPPIELVEPASPKSKRPIRYKNDSEKMNLPVTDDSMVRSDRTRTNSVITLDDDQETIHIDDINHDSECALQQSSDSNGVQKENFQKAVQVEHLESELKITPNRNSSSVGEDSPDGDIVSLVALSIEGKDDIHLSDTEVPRKSETGDCCVKGLKDSPPPDHLVYDKLRTILARENRKIHFITGDGNCFFRALAKILYGSETYHAAIRTLIVDIIATNKSRFAQFVDENDVQGHIQKMAKDHCWATTCEIYAAATVLQRDIYVLTPHPLNKTYSWLLFKPVFKSTFVPVSFSKQLCYITLCNTNGNHYDLVVADHGKCNCFLAYPELGGINASIDLT